MLHRFFSATELVPGERAKVEGDEAHHASRVSRVRTGERVELVDAGGISAEAVVESVTSEVVVARVEQILVSRESPLTVTLGLALIKLDLFEMVLQKGTELGVSAFLPMITDRAEIPPERAAGKAERWERIVREAVKQSGRSLVPRIETPRSFDDVLRDGGDLIMFEASGAGDDLPHTAGRITLLVGPEGGWSERELALAAGNRVPSVRLGPRRLRAETAGLAAVIWSQMHYGDF